MEIQRLRYLGLTTVLSTQFLLPASAHVRGEYGNQPETHAYSVSNRYDSQGQIAHSSHQFGHDNQLHHSNSNHGPAQHGHGEHNGHHGSSHHATKHKKASTIKFDGTCNGSDRCSVNLDGDYIGSKDGGIYIKTDNIIGWNFTNASNRGGVLFNSTNEDYRVSIKHFDHSGKRKLSQIGFFNFKTAQSFVSNLELISGLAPNHDQAGPTTHCTASGKDSNSGTQYDGGKASGIAGSIGNSFNRASAAYTGGVIGGVTADAIFDSATSTAIGAGVGALAGAAIVSPSGSFNLKRGIVSEVRGNPAKSSAFSDGSFNGRKDCIDEPTIATTNVNIQSPIPVYMEKPNN